MPINRIEESNHRDIIVIGASAGGIEALKVIVEGLPADLPASILVVTHLHPEHKSILPEILSRKGPLPAVAATNGEAIKHRHIYIAPPDHHMVIQGGVIKLNKGPKENFHRPAINPFFRSAADCYGPRVIGVILTGMLDDGTAGLIAVKMSGGIAIVQNPRDALYPDMPRNASRYIEVDYTSPLSEIAWLLDRLCREPIKDGGIRSMREDDKKESRKISHDISALENSQKVEGQTYVICPDCGGPMWEFHTGKFKQFQCRVGHKYSPETLLAGKAEILEQSLWMAIRSLEERASLLREMINATHFNRDEEELSRLRQEEAAAAEKAKRIRHMMNGESQPA